MTDNKQKINPKLNSISKQCQESYVNKYIDVDEFLFVFLLSLRSNSTYMKYIWNAKTI